jgi:hypothetical protein
MTLGWFLALICSVAFALAVWSAMKADEAAREASKRALQRSLDDQRR